MGIKIDDLPAVTTLTGPDEFPLVQNGIARVATVNQLITALQSGLLNEIPAWAPFTTYQANQLVVNPAGAIVQALAHFTSGAAFDATNWTALSLTVSGVQALVGTETTRATAAEGTLTANLAAEVARAQAAEQALQSALLSELPEWRANTAYATQTLVVNPAGLIVQALASVPPRASYTPADWTILSLTLATVQALIAAQAAADSTTYATHDESLINALIFGS